MAPGIRTVVDGHETRHPGGEVLRLGRDPASEIVVDNPYVSRQHARLVPRDSGWLLEDLGSKHGTYVEDERIIRLPVTGEVTVSLGHPPKGVSLTLVPDRVSIFICYRTSDSAAHAGRLGDWLGRHFGPDQVFLDVSAIDYGEDFVTRVQSAISSCRVVLVIIGRTWATTTDEAGEVRLFDPTDTVRLEVATALAARPQVQVIPVFVDGAQMPRRDALPEDLRSLATLNGPALAHRTWQAGVDNLIECIERYAGRTDLPAPTDSPETTTPATGAPDPTHQLQAHG
jgi:hypothetical protein